MRLFDPRGDQPDAENDQRKRHRPAPAPSEQQIDQLFRIDAPRHRSTSAIDAKNQVAVVVQITAALAERNGGQNRATVAAVLDARETMLGRHLATSPSAQNHAFAGNRPRFEARQVTVPAKSNAARRARP